MTELIEKLIKKFEKYWFTLLMVPAVLFLTIITATLFEPDGLVWDIFLFLGITVSSWMLMIFFFLTQFSQKTKFSIGDFLFSDKSDETVRLINKLREIGSGKYMVFSFYVLLLFLVSIPFTVYKAFFNN